MEAPAAPAVSAGDEAALAAQQLKDKIVVIKPPIIVKDLAGKLGLKPYQIIHHLMEMNIFTGAAQALEEEVARKLTTKLGFTFEIEKREKGAGQVHAPVKIVEPPKPEPVAASELQPRPPVITFMGHVDHGKTSLLDAIRKARVAAGEAGGITQHIGAYTVKRGNQTITFLDTPGHEAFTAMRARGAKTTDIVVLVVAADDGIMPTTIEAIQHARAAKVQIMVAINKIDLPSANLNRVKGQLQEQGLVPEEYGGDTIVCEVSATKGIGIEKLLEMMLLQAEVLELRANPRGNSRGTVIESQFEQGRGPTATVLVQSGTLRVGDAILAGPYYGRVKALINDLGQTVKEAGPSIPVKILGLDGAPSPGEEYNVLKNEREARELAEDRRDKLRLGKLEAPPRMTLENLFEAIADEKHKVLKLILKGDVQGSVEGDRHFAQENREQEDRPRHRRGFGRRDFGIGHSSGQGLQRRGHRLQHPHRQRRCQRRQARGRADQALLHHLRAPRPGEGGDGRHARPRAARDQPRHRRGQAGLPALEVSGRRLQRRQRAHRAQTAGPASCASASRSTTARSSRSSASRTTSPKCAPGWSAAFAWVISTITWSTTPSSATSSRRWRRPCNPAPAGRGPMRRRECWLGPRVPCVSPVP